MDEKKDFLFHLDACRVCLQIEDLESLFTVDEDIHYAQKLMICSTVEVTPQDNLPLKICKSCIANLNTAYNFKQQCEATDKILRSNIKSNQTNEETNLEIQEDRYNFEDIKIKIEGSITDVDNVFIDDVFNNASDDEKLINIFSKNIAEKTNLLLDENKKTSKLPHVLKGTVIDSTSASNDTENIVAIDTERKNRTVKKPKKKPSQISANSEFKCSYCPKTFPNNSQLIVHLRYHTGERPFLCTNCPKRFYIKADLLRHSSNIHDNRKPYSCNECGKCFGLRNGLVVHMRTHTGEKPFKCTECGSSFTQSGSLREHQRTHTGEQPLVCSEPQCGKAFASHSALARHRRIHSGELRGQCTVCGKKFFAANYLKHHMKIHTGEKPCVCKICGRAFTMSSAMLKHMTTHDPDIKTVCSLCGVSVVSIAKHMKSHSNDKPYKCTHCDKRFKQPSGLSYHLTFHTNERKYPCLSCDKKFKSKQALKNHKSIHSSDKPFKCEICQVSFGNLSYKNRHNRTYHSSTENKKRATKRPYNKKIPLTIAKLPNEINDEIFIESTTNDNKK